MVRNLDMAHTGAGVPSCPAVRVVITSQHPFAQHRVVSIDAKKIAGRLRMSKRAEDFMDSWLDAKVTDRHLKAPEKSAPILAKKCATDAKKAGVPLEELEEVV